MGNTNVNQRGFSGNRGFGWLNATRQYLRFLTSQGVILPNYGVQLQWDNFIHALSPRPANASMIQPRNLAAYYPNDPTAIYLDGSNNVTLWEDRSGNSATNTLCLNGVAGNYGSAPNAAPIQILGDIDIRVYVAATDWTPAAQQTLISKYDTGLNQRAYGLFLNTDGTLTLNTSTSGTSGTIFANSSIATGVSDNSAKWVRATRILNDGAGNRITTFYLSDDGVNWIVLGAPAIQVGVILGIFNSSAALTIGSTLNSGTSNTLFTGRIYRATLYNGVAESGGTLVFDADFSKVAKLATSFTESSANAATVTVNSTGDTGARIAGERDLYQGTTSKRPAYTQANGRQRLFLTFDGTDDYLKAPSFALVQPETIYYVGSQVTFTVSDKFYDGNSATERMALSQVAPSPTIAMFAGTADVLNGGLSLGIRVILTAVFNGAASLITINRGTPGAGNPGTNSANGFTLAASSTATLFGNITTSEIAIYAEAHNAQTQASIIGYLSNKYSIGL